jgi:hypothetical protein
MNKFKVEFTLKQHTPLIHFQAEQSGATLRATELKPKFDRFLKEYVFKNNAQIYNNFLIDKKKCNDKKLKVCAFDYKIKITSKIKNNEIVFKTYISKYKKNNNMREGAYFGDNNAVELSNIQVEFLSFNTNLINYIKDNFIDFILITNFGTRQNKGFGSFSVIKVNDKEINLNYSDIKKRIMKYCNIVGEIETNYPLKDILDIYQIAKSGRRENNRKLTKSKLMEYFKNNLRWEKRWIKKELKEKNRVLFNDLVDDYHKKNGWSFSENEKYAYIRALLGIADNIEFITYSYRQKSEEIKAKKSELKKEKDNSKKEILKKDIKKLSKEADGLKIKVTISHVGKGDKKVERFASPVTFKVINEKVYILTKKENIIKICNEKFKFVASYKNGDKKTELGTLKVPQISDQEALNIFRKIFKYKSKIKHKDFNSDSPFISLHKGF